MEAKSIKGFIKTKFQPKLKDAELIIQGIFLFLIYLFQDYACFKFGEVIFLYRFRNFSRPVFTVLSVFRVFSVSPLIKKILVDEVGKMSFKKLGSCDVNYKLVVILKS